MMTLSRFAGPVAGIAGLAAVVAYISDLIGGWASVRFRRRPKMENMTGKVVVITGGNAGIGIRCVEASARLGATVVLCCRTPQKGIEALAALKLPSECKVEVMELDQSSLASVKKFAEKFTQTYSKLDVLILNAGIARTFLGTRGFRKTTDGFEEMVGVNYLAHFYLTVLLLPSLRSTPGARVIAQTSVAAGNAYHRGIDVRTWRDRCSDYQDWKQYAQSKMALLLFVRILQRREPSLLCLACHPGVVDGTGLLHQAGIGPVEYIYTMVLFILLSMRVETSHLSTIFLASTSEKLQQAGFYWPVGRLMPWPRNRVAEAFQRVAGLQLPLKLRTDHAPLWEETMGALRQAGAEGL